MSKSKKQSPISPNYSADRPIRKITEDLLGRGKFAERLLSDIQIWNAEDSLVIGLYGSWGAGKTSLKNLVLELNGRRSKRALPVFEFNPWQLSGKGSISERFLVELGISLNKGSSQKEIENRSRKLQAYSETLSVSGSMLRIVGKAMPMLGVPGGPIVEHFGQGLKDSADSTAGASKALSAQAEAMTRTIDEIKGDLAEDLRKRKKPLLVVIDDIDRLSKQEILEVFQLVKANADFPKIIYILLFERTIVAQALDEITNNHGMEFLEKIVQVAYHIPAPPAGAIEKTLFKELDKLVELPPAKRLWSDRRWINIYIGGISGYFQNLRHVHRYLASFNFHFRQHLTTTSLEVNPIDLIGLEVLRIFEPALFERLPGAKTILTKETDAKSLFRIKQDSVDADIDQLLLHVPESRRIFAKKILVELFPPLQNSSLDGTHGDRPQWLRQARICCDELFDRYFSHTIRNDELSQTELDELLANRRNPARFCEIATTLIERGLIKAALERLDAHKEETPADENEHYIEGLSNLSDRLPKRAPGLTEVDHGIMVFRIAYFGLKQIASADERFSRLYAGIKRATGLSLPLDFITTELRDRAKYNEGLEFLIDEKDLPSLKKIGLEQVRKAAKNGTLKNNAKLLSILYDWLKLSPNNEPKAWILPQIKTETDALWLIDLLTSEAHSWGGEHRVGYGIQLEAIEKFSNVELVENLLKNTDGKQLPGKQGKALQAFRRALARRAAGKSDDPWADDRHYEVVK